jgi:hypothetical protein
MVPEVEREPNEIERAIINLLTIEVRSAMRGLPLMQALAEMATTPSKGRGDTVKFRRPV